MRLLLSLPLLLLAPLALLAATPDEAMEKHTFKGEKGTLPYRLLKPAGYDSKDDNKKEYPLVIFLHGAGERGTDNKAQLRHGLKNFVEVQKTNPCFVVAPQCPTGSSWAKFTGKTVKMAKDPSPTGKLVLELFMHDRDGGIDPKAEVSVPVDGTVTRLPAGGLLKLDPGQSVTLLPGVWHAFWAEGKDVLIGEVSTVNDDLTDNVFREPIGRFSNIDEDVAPLHLLVSDYEKWVG